MWLSVCVFLLFSAILVEYLHVVLRPVIEVPLLFTRSEVIMLLSASSVCFKTFIFALRLQINPGEHTVSAPECALSSVFSKRHTAAELYS